MSRRPLALLVPVALLALVGSATAQTPAVEFRIVERGTGSGASNVVSMGLGAATVANFAVQARVVGGPGALGNFNFDIVGVGEPDVNGTLARVLISNADGTYALNSANSTNSTVGRGGLAAQYTYLAGISAAFNGSINVSTGSFTQTAGNQEIGIVTGSPTGNALLAVADTDGDGNPDSYLGAGTTAPLYGSSLPSSTIDTYFGQNGNWIDVYRFKYTITNTASRQFQFTLMDLGTQIMTGYQLANGIWGPVQANASATVTPATVFVAFPAPGSAAVFCVGSIIAARRRR